MLALALPLSKSFQDSCLEKNGGLNERSVFVRSGKQLKSCTIYGSRRKRRILPIDGVENFFGERYSVVPRQIASTPQQCYAIKCPYIPRFRSVRFKPIRKSDGHQVKIYRRPKRATQV
ncbi:hypothetical protein T08_12901 [Trichinella sp. T8]|nr:hypothetical protein T08_12901 [Trichinella sp. T8]